MADPKSRELARDKLAEIYSTELISGSPQVVQEVHNHMPFEFAKAPAVIVQSAGTMRGRAGTGTGRYRTPVKLETVVFVPRARKGSDWTEAKVEDLLDTIEWRIAKTIAANRRIVGIWVNLFHIEGDFSLIMPATVGGKNYMMEVIPVIAILEA